eukprot:jgi/Chlat1/5104/Chrsp33S05024
MPVSTRSGRELKESPAPPSATPSSRRRRQATAGSRVQQQHVLDTAVAGSGDGGGGGGGGEDSPAGTGRSSEYVIDSDEDQHSVSVGRVVLAATQVQSAEEEEEEEEYHQHVQPPSVKPVAKPTTVTTATTVEGTADATVKRRVIQTSRVEVTQVTSVGEVPNPASGSSVPVASYLLPLLILFVAAMLYLNQGRVPNWRIGQVSLLSQDKSGSRQRPCYGSVSAAELSSFLPQTEEWLEMCVRVSVLSAVFIDDVRAKAGDKQALRARAQPTKALVALLAGRTQGNSQKAAQAVSAVFSQCVSTRCLLHIIGGDYSNSSVSSQESRGQLQLRLAEFLDKCPDGVIVVEALDSIQADVLNALVPALSETGSYAHMGKSIPAWNALVLLTMEVPSFSKEWLKSHDDFDHAVKHYLQTRIQHELTSKVIRRRVEYVLPYNC